MSAGGDRMPTEICAAEKCSHSTTMVGRVIKPIPGLINWCKWKRSALPRVFGNANAIEGREKTIKRAKQPRRWGGDATTDEPIRASSGDAVPPLGRTIKEKS